MRPVVGNENFAVRLCFCQQYAVVIIFASFLSPDTTLVLKQHSAWYVPMIVLISAILYHTPLSSEVPQPADLRNALNGMPRAEYQTRLALESPELMSMGLKTFQHSHHEIFLGIQSWHGPLTHGARTTPINAPPKNPPRRKNHCERTENYSTTTYLNGINF